MDTPRVVKLGAAIDFFQCVPKLMPSLINTLWENRKGRRITCEGSFGTDRISRPATSQ